MKTINFRVLVFLSSILVLLAGCERRDKLDDYPVSGVLIKLDWSKATDVLPEGVRVIFYPKSAEGRKVERYLPVQGGVVNVPPGHYDMVIYNYDTEAVVVKNANAYETIEAFAVPCYEPGAKEGTVWSPDPIYVVCEEELRIKNIDEVTELAYQPKLLVKSYSFEVKATGLHNVSRIVGHVEGMRGCYRLGNFSCDCPLPPIYFEGGKGDGVIKGYFTTFGTLVQAATRVDLSVMLNLSLVKIDGSVQEVKIDITEAVQPPPPGEDGEDPPPSVDIEIPEDEKIEIEDVKPGPGGGGGVGGDVGDWGDEDEVVLPMKQIEE